MIQPSPLDNLVTSVPDAPCLPDAPAPERTNAAPETKDAASEEEEALRRKYPPIPNHPLARLSGSFNNEPLWDEFWQHVLEYREKQNEIEDD